MQVHVLERKAWGRIFLCCFKPEGELVGSYRI